MKVEILKKLKTLWDKVRYREVRHIHDTSKPIYYIIRRKSPGAGFFSNYFYVLSHLSYANKQGWLSVVDMQNYPTLYTEKEEIFGTRNGWEYYFKQLADISIEEAYASNNYVISNSEYLCEEGVPVYSINQGHITREMTENLFSLQDKYVPVKKALIEEIDNLYRSLIGNSSCVGIHVRGTDMNVVWDGHTLPPGIIKIQNVLDKLLKSDSNLRIFLCCDEENTVAIFKEKYNERVITLSAYRSKSNDRVGIHMQKSNRKNHKYLLGKEVLTDCLMLSKCDYLICGISNVTSAAIMFNDLKYKDVFLIK